MEDTHKSTSGFVEFVRRLESGGSEAKSTGSSPRTLRVFNRGEYFTLHGQDALFIADEYFKTRDVIKYLGSAEDKLPGVSISRAKLSAVLRDALLTRKWTVEVYSRESGGANDEWSLDIQGTAADVSVFSPVTDVELLSSAAASAASQAMALRVALVNGVRRVGVAYIDASSAVLSVGEFSDSDAFLSLSACVAQRPAVSCVLALDSASLADVDNERIRSILDDANVTVRESTIKPASLSSSSSLTMDALHAFTALASETQQQDFSRFLSSERLAAGALQALAAVNDLQRVASSAGGGKLKIAYIDVDNFMKLDQSALAALNIFPSPTDTDKTMCLAGILGRTGTSMGLRRLHQWLRLPLLDKVAIERRLDMVEALVENPGLLMSVAETMRGIPDVERLLKKVQREQGSLTDVVGLYQFVSRLPALVNHISSCAESSTSSSSVKDDDDEKGMSALQKLDKHIGSVLATAQSEAEAFVTLVQRTVDLEHPQGHEYFVSPSFNDDLAELHAKRTKLVGKMEKVLSEIADDLGLDEKKVKLNHSSALGYHVRVSRKDEKNLRSAKGYVTLETRKDGVRFTSPEMKRLSRDHADVNEEYLATQAVIVSKALEVTLSYVPVIEAAAHCLADLDVYCALARAATSSAATPYVRPRIRERGSGVFRLIGARHPCLEVQAGVSFIANDVDLVKGKSSVQIVTGPNMGGKSTYIRTAGVVAVMAQLGSFVPCDSADISIVDCVLARVGAGDSQLKGVSTFMKEMLEAAAILKGATSDSLVIIDELGRGTSTYDGFGLAWAIGEHIASVTNAYALFATHFHELTALADTLPNVVNKHVTAHTGHGTITMLYRLRDGPCDRSFGIHVAELANFPAEVVAMAKKKAEELESFGQASSSFVAPPPSSSTTTSSSSSSSSSPAAGTMSDKDGDAVVDFLKHFASVEVDELVGAADGAVVQALLKEGQAALAP